ncbi:MAG: winged helix-turn-helix domain-containing protein [Candidatus Ranarchaeia archaeon]
MVEGKSSKYFRILSHEIRRDILSFIQRSSPTSFTELNNKFQLEVGTLYYHLKILAPLIQQDSDHRYYLTDAGKEAYQLSKQQFSPDGIETPQPLSLPQKRVQTFFLVPLIKYLQQEPKRTVVEAALLSILTGFLAFAIGLQPEFLFHTTTTYNTVFDPFLGVMGRWFFIFIIIQAIARYLFKRQEGILELFGIIPFCILPIALYPAIWFLLFSGLIPYNVILDLFIQICLQIWGLGSLAFAIERIKKLRFERAVLISLFVQYANILIVWIGTLFF